MEKLVIEMNEANLVVEKYDGVESAEFIVYFQDKATGCVTQDIVTIREAVHDGEFGSVECLVWANENDENYTDSFLINRHQEVD